MHALQQDTRISGKIYTRKQKLAVASFASDYMKIEHYIVFVFCFRVKMWNKRRKKNKSKKKTCN